MANNQLDSFLNLIQNQFKEENRDLINETTDIKTLKEWSSLQTMIVVNEIDKEYNVLLNTDDIKQASSIDELFKIVKTKQS
jgi:acyl carrier protein